MRQQVTQILCDTSAGAARKNLAKKKDGNVLLQNLTDIRKEKMEGIIIKTNKQTSKQIPAWNYIISLPDPISLSLPWEPFCSHE